MMHNFDQNRKELISVTFTVKMKMRPLMSYQNYTEHNYANKCNKINYGKSNQFFKMIDIAQTHFSSGCIVAFTFTLCFHFFALQPVCFSHSLGVCILDPHEPHLQTMLQHKTIRRSSKNPSQKQIYFII